MGDSSHISCHLLTSFSSLNNLSRRSLAFRLLNEIVSLRILYLIMSQRRRLLVMSLYSSNQFGYESSGNNVPSRTKFPPKYFFKTHIQVAHSFRSLAVARLLRSLSFSRSARYRSPLSFLHSLVSFRSLIARLTQLAEFLKKYFGEKFFSWKEHYYQYSITPRQNKKNSSWQNS